MPSLNTNTVNAAVREKSDAQLVDDLHRVENVLLIETFGSAHETRRELEAEMWMYYNELKRRGKLESQKKANHQKKSTISRPQCQYRGTKPHAATHLLVWMLNSGIWIKFSCEEHKQMFGGPGYWVTKLEGFEDNWERPIHPLGTPEPSQTELSQPDEVPLPEEEREDAWGTKQRALTAQAAAEDRPRAINK